MPSSIFTQTPLRSLFEVRITVAVGISKKKRCDWDQTLKRSSAMDSEFGVSSKVTRELLPTIAGPFLSPRSVERRGFWSRLERGETQPIFYLASTNVANLRLWRSWAIFLSKCMRSHPEALDCNIFTSVSLSFFEGPGVLQMLADTVLGNSLKHQRKWRRLAIICRLPNFWNQLYTLYNHSRNVNNSNSLVLVSISPAILSCIIVSLSLP